MELSKKQTQFYAVLLIACVAIAITVTLIDFTIKASILDESARLREVIRNGEKPAGSNDNGIDVDAPIDFAIPSPILDSLNARVETGSHPNGNTRNAHTTRGRRTNGGAASDSAQIPPGD